MYQGGVKAYSAGRVNNLSQRFKTLFVFSPARF
jgi:hypothetical protein